jgi:DNA-binding response OmpR family regulator
MLASLSLLWILFVEDESVIREVSTRALVGAGYHVDAVEDGQFGWAALQAHPYDLLITDNQMPRLSGGDLILKLRSARMTLPVILASGTIVPEQVAPGSSLQPVIPLPKPFTSDQLLAMVAEVLRRPGRDPAETEGFSFASGDSYSHWGINE